MACSALASAARLAACSASVPPSRPMRWRHRRSARRIDQDRAHRARGVAEELQRIGELRSFLVADLDVELVHERGGVQRRAAGASALPARHRLEALIDVGEQPVGGLQRAQRRMRVRTRGNPSSCRSILTRARRAGRRLRKGGARSIGPPVRKSWRLRAGGAAARLLETASEHDRPQLHGDRAARAGDVGDRGADRRCTGRSPAASTSCRCRNPAVRAAGAIRAPFQYSVGFPSASTLPLPSVIIGPPPPRSFAATDHSVPS